MATIEEHLVQASKLQEDISAFMGEIDYVYGPLTSNISDEDERQKLAFLVAVIDDALIGLKYIKTTLAKKGYWSSPKDEKLYSLGDGSVAFNASTSKTKWDHKRVASVVIERLMAKQVDYDTGEMIPTSQLMTQLLDIVGISYWKVTKLRELNIDPEQYSEEGTTSYSASVKRN